MDQIRIGIQGYLAETVLHGFKYLQFNNGCIFKFGWVNNQPFPFELECKFTLTFSLFQALVIILSFTYSMVIIKESYEDWNSNPILTTTEEIGASLTEVDFPTTTICHEPKYQVDNWELPELILNFFSFTPRFFAMISKLFLTMSITVLAVL